MKSENEADMTNRLAEIQRKNVRGLMEHLSLTAPDMAELTGMSRGSIANTFGGKPRTIPSKRTMKALYKVFEMVAGSLERSDFDPTTVGLKEEGATPTTALPAVIPQTAVRLTIGKTVIDTELSSEDAEKVLRFVVFGDSL